MQIIDYPLCCKARILIGFGLGHINENDEVAKFSGRSEKGYEGCRASPEEIKRYLDKVIPTLQQMTIQVLFACPTSNQPEAIKALQEYGFFTAEQEDLEQNALTYKVRKYAGERTYTSRDVVTGEMLVKHHMVPMFYLVPLGEREKGVFELN